MSPEERQLLTGLFDRIRGAAGTPRDPEAEALISDTVRNMPYAPYLLAQAVIVQDQALRAANDKLQQLEAQLRDMEQQQPRQATGTGGFLGGLGSIFGAGNPPAGPAPQPGPQPGPWGQQPPQPSYQQPYAPPPPPPSGGPWGGGPGMGAGMGGGMMGAPMGGGGGFLQGALGAAAGVAGGVLLADSIRGLFGAHNNPLGIGTGFGGLGTGTGGGETIVNNYYESPDSTAADASNADYSDNTQDASYDDSGNDSGSDSGSGDGGSFDV
ncbi:MAG: DUF2076 domain-containing protein [Methylovirgula sp.]